MLIHGVAGNRPRPPRRDRLAPTLPSPRRRWQRFRRRASSRTAMTPRAASGWMPTVVNMALGSRNGPSKSIPRDDVLTPARINRHRAARRWAADDPERSISGRPTPERPRPTRTARPYNGSRPSATPTCNYLQVGARDVPLTGSLPTTRSGNLQLLVSWGHARGVHPRPRGAASTSASATRLGSGSSASRCCGLW